MRMTSKLSGLFLAVLLTAASACKGGSSGGAGGTADNSAGRKERVVANLKAKYPRLGDLNPSLGDFKRLTPGMDEVTLSLNTPRGEQKNQLLVTTDDKTAYIVMEGPIDVSKDAKQLAADEQQKKSDRQGALTQVTQGKPERGNPNAKVTIVEFSDFQCPYCKRAADTIDQLLKKYPNDVRLVYVNFPLPFHPWAEPAAVAAVCAAKQDPSAFWKLYDSYFANQNDINPQNVLDKTQQFLAGTKVNVAQWDKCAKDTANPDHQAAQKQVEESKAAGTKLGVEGTPAFFINGEFVSGALPFEQFDQMVQQQLKAKG